MRIYKLLSATIITFTISCLVLSKSYSLPQGGSVVGGAATLSNPSANIEQVKQTSSSAIINWQTFNVGAQQHVNFIQPSASSIILNRINPNNGASAIFGTLTANGQVWLINGAGIWFGPSSHVDVAGLVATTANISNQDFMNGNYRFQQSPNWNGAIVNDGYILVHSAGLAALVGNGVVNNGHIVSNSGTVVLGASKVFTIDFNGDQLVNFAVGSNVTKPAVDANGHTLSYAVANKGTIIANGGQVVLTAQVAGQVLDNAINMSGVIEANSVSQHNGTIIIEANRGTVRISGKVTATGTARGQHGGSITILGDQVALIDNAFIDVSGDNGGGNVLIGGNAQNAGVLQNSNYTFVGSNAVIKANALTSGNGGNVKLLSNLGTQFYGTIDAQGGSLNGNGGDVETSGGNLAFLGEVNTSAPHGLTGTLLLDPTNLYIVNGATGSGDQDANFTGSTLAFTAPNTLDNTISVGELQSLGNTNILLQATNTLTVGDALNNAATVNLTGLTSDTITLQAGNGSGGAGNVIFNTGSTLTTGGGGVTILAGQSGDTSGTATLGSITTNNGNFLVNALGAVNLNELINTGSGTATINVNQGSSADNFTMGAASSITNTNTTANAVAINVNAASGGTGAAILGNITTGNGGTISIETNTGRDTDGGSITQISGTELNAGANGNIILAVPVTSASNIQSNVYGGNLSLTSGKNGSNITSINDLSLALDNSNARSPLTLQSNGALTIASSVNTGVINLSADNGITVDNNLTGLGPMVINANANNSGAGILTINDGFTVSSTGYDIAITASDINLNTTGALTSGAGMLTVNASGTAGIIGIGTGAGGTFNLNNNELINITATGAQVFNAANGITFNTDYTTTGKLTLNADDNNNGVGELTLLGASVVDTTNNPLVVNTGSLALNAGTLNAGTNTLTMTATGALGSIGLGTGAGGSINITTPQFLQLIANGKTFNAADGINVTYNYITLGSLTLNADSNDDGTGLFNVANGVIINSSNNSLNIVAGTMDLNATGILDSGTGAFSLTATSYTANSLGIGDGSGGSINLSNAELATQIIANGSRTFNANNGITVSTDPSDHNALVLNADYNNDGTGLLTIANYLDLITNNDSLSLTAATLSLGANSILNSGSGAFTFRATGISSTSVPPSLGIGDGSTGAIIAFTNAQWQTQVIATGARTLIGRDGLYINENLDDGSALTLSADGDDNGIGILTIAPATIISSGNQALNITAATAVLNNNDFNHGTGSLTINATGVSAPSLGLGDTAGGDFNIDNAVLLGSTGAGNPGPLTFNGYNGINVAYNIPNTAGNTLTFNSDSNYNHVGTLTVLPTYTINSNNSQLNITAANLSLQNLNSLNSGTANTAITATASLGIGTATGIMSISNAELQTITAKNLTLTTNNDSITSTGVTNTAVSNISNALYLDANPNTSNNTASNPNALAATVNFIGTTSDFNNLVVQGASGINIASNIVATGSVMLGQTPDDGLNNISVIGSQSVIAANGITLNDSSYWSGGSTFTLNADSNSAHIGNLTVATGISLGGGEGNLNVITNELLLNGVINLGTTGNIGITGTGSVGMGDAVGQNLTLSTPTLEKITANNLTVNSAYDDNILVDNTNISTSNSLNNIIGSVTLNAISGVVGSSITFQNNDSTFNALSATANDGINLNTDVNVATTMNLTANGASNIIEAAGVAVTGTSGNSTLNLTTGTGNAVLTNANNSFNELSANSTSGDISYTNLAQQNLVINNSNLGAGDLTVTTQGSGGMTQSGALSGNQLSVQTDLGDVAFNGLSNNFATFEAASNGGNIQYTNLGNLTLLSSNVGNSGQLHINTQHTSDLSTGGNDQGNKIYLTAGGNLRLYANVFTANSVINFAAGQAISGLSLVDAPELNSPTIVMTANQVASMTAPIDLRVAGLMSNSIIMDASNETGLGTVFGYHLITTRLILDATGQYYEYPLIAEPVSPTNPITSPTRDPATLTLDELNSLAVSAQYTQDLLSQASQANINCASYTYNLPRYNNGKIIQKSSTYTCPIIKNSKYYSNYRLSIDPRLTEPSLGAITFSPRS